MISDSHAAINFSHVVKKIKTLTKKKKIFELKKLRWMYFITSSHPDRLQSPRKLLKGNGASSEDLSVVTFELPVEQAKNAPKAHPSVRDTGQ